MTEALLRARTREALLHAVCELAASIPLALAWADLSASDTGRRRTVAWHGPAADLLQGDTEDMQHAPDPASLRERARERGFHAYAAVPLLCAGQRAGTLHLHAAEPGAFDSDDHRALFEQIAGSASAALERLDRADTPRPRDQAADRASDETTNLLMNIIDSTSDFIFVKDRNLRSILCNQAFARSIGKTPEELYGRTDIENGWDPELVHGNPDKGIRGFEHDDLAALAGQHVYNPADPAPIDGELRIFDTHKMPLRNAQGELIGVMGIARDITERVRAEQALARSEASLRQAQALARVGSWELVNDRVIWEEITYQIFGQPLGQEITYQDFLGFVHADDRPLIEASWQTTAAGQPHDIEYRIVTSTGEVRWIRTKAKLTTNSDGQPSSAVGMVQDITDRKHAEEALRRLNTELEQRVAARTAALERVNKELEAFTYSVSHDLKAPLRAIDGYSTLLLREHAGQLDQEGCRLLGKVCQATGRMGELIEDLLAYSRLERHTISPGPIDPHALVDTLLAEHAQEIAARGVAVHVDASCSSSVAADREGLAMALRNLLENALKFTRDVPSPRIEIGGHQADTASVLWVRDNGCGFDMEYRDRIFEIFQRLHRVEDYPGTGVGLALVRKAMERMGGRAWAESRPGGGATFYLEIPRSA